MMQIPTQNTQNILFPRATLDSIKSNAQKHKHLVTHTSQYNPIPNLQLHWLHDSKDGPSTATLTYI